MKKKLFACVLALATVLALALPVSAETVQGKSDWQVTFTQDKEMVSSFKTADIDDVIMGMQPGDNAVITLSLTNSHSATTDWYMTNKVLSSLEDSVGVASGGAYTYILTYTNSKGEVTTLFSSDTVGGDTISAAGEGLHEATDALQDYFYLDTLTSGQSGKITLEVALDGETQGNSYQDTLADLQMNFAVELRDSSVKVVKTGDESNSMAAIIVAAVAGVLLLVLAIVSVRRRKKNKEEQ